MLFQNVCIEEFTYVLPESKVSSFEIEHYLSPLYKKLKLIPGTLEALTGVKNRHLWPVDLNPSFFAGSAGERLLKDSNFPPHEIDLLIYAGVCRDYIEPATAHIVHNKLKLKPSCLSFDLSNACVGFLNSMRVAAQMIEAEQIRSALILSGENAAPLLQRTINFLLKEATEENFRNALASLTLGSGAVAMLLTHKKISKKQHKLLNAVSEIASEYHHLCFGEGDYRSPLMKTDSLQLLEKGVELSERAWGIFLKELSFSSESFDHIFTHQVSLVHQEKIFKSFNLSSQRGRQDCVYFGNTGSIAAPLSLILSEQENKLRKGDKIALLGIGSGLNTMMLGIQW